VLGRVMLSPTYLDSLIVYITLQQAEMGRRNEGRKQIPSRMRWEAAAVQSPRKDAQCYTFSTPVVKQN